MRILCLSNGHGEDTIAVVLLQALRAYDVELLAMPIVGEGRAYRSLDIPIIGPTQTMPSGGFIYMDARQLWRDLQEGLGTLTLKQIAAVQKIAPQMDLVLAVGDIVVQVLAWSTRRPHCFVGTAKSDYYIGGKPSVYNGWERWHMRHPRCQAVYPRDRVTTLNLQKLGVSRAYDLGNPMMDGLEPQGYDWEKLGLGTHQLLITLLPGSRPPECYRNFLVLLAATQKLKDQALSFVAALAYSLQGPEFIAALASGGWQYQQQTSQLASIECDGVTVHLVWGAFADCLQRAQLVMAMTGTGTEQAVGLGKPVISLVGEGPQFTYRFAEAQTRLLGPSVTLLQDLQEVLPTVQNLLKDPALRQQIAVNGHERMGTPGAAQRIVQHIMAERTLS